MAEHTTVKHCVENCVAKLAKVQQADLWKLLAAILNKSVQTAQSTHPGLTAQGLRIEICHRLCDETYGASDSSQAKSPDKLSLDLDPPKP